jgi:chromosome segregation protein
MRLKSLEVIGFKSFVDRLHLSFPEGITTIVGPNGCGKSNIVDAILWAIGERSAKHLRGRLMEDVIFGGTDGRKPLGMAEVNLTFSNDGRLAPRGYEQYSEVTVTRRLYRSGESEYLINRIPCRLRDITDLFLDTGIGVNGYSIVEQGRVEYLIHANPQDRRFLIEEAAGIAKYKERKRLALMKMDATQQNLLRIQDIIAEVKRQIVTLERQVKRAEEYKAIRKEAKEIEIRFALQEYAELSEKGEVSRGYLKALRDRDSEISAQTAQKEALIERMRVSAVEEEEKLRTLQQDVFDLTREIQKLENEIEFFRREEGGLQKQEGQFTEEVRESLRVWRETRRERKRTERMRRNLEEERHEKEEIVKEWEALFNDFRTTYQEVADQLETEKGGFIDILTQLTSLKNRQSHLEERREDLQKRIRSHEKESQEVREGLVRLEETLSRIEKERALNLSLQNILKEERVGWEGEIERLKDVLRTKQTERSSLAERLRQDRSRFLSLKELQENYEGFEKGVKSILLKKKVEQEKWEPLLGVVADILEPEPKYEVPLEAVLGQRLQYLVVESEKVAMEAIAFLKRESLGRGSFVPIGVKGNGNSNRSLQTGPVCREAGEGGKPLPLLQFVNVQEGFAPIAEFLIGDVGVIGHLEGAFHRIKEEGGFGTLVTMEGEVVERSGVVSGGSLDQGLSILERRREIRGLERRIEEEEERCQKAREEEERLQQEMVEREAQLEKRKNEIQEKEIELLHQERDLEELKKEISQLHQKMEVLQFEGRELQEEEQAIDEEMQSVLAQMEREETVKQEKEVELQSLKKTVEEVREGTEELGGRITEKKVFLASIEEKQKGMEGQILNLSGNLKTLNEQIIKRVRGIREFRNESASLREKILQWEGELEGSLEQHRLKEESLSGQKENVELLSNEWKEMEASSKYLRRELEDVRQKVHEEEMKVSEIQLKLSHLQDSMKERYGTTLSTSVGVAPLEFPKEEMSKRLAELKSALEGFGEVNLMAIEEYQELKQRHDFLTEQQADLQQALETLRKVIIRINRTTTKRFLETFHLVNERFKQVFMRLFKGGQASLLLLDEQDPSTTGIDIIAQPPGKKLQNIDLLSGGEKALVATALLFGLFMIKPTPFCLLDEVDAPLDDANINRFIDLVKEFSKASQFILITHNKSTMETANTLYGVTMETPGVSKVVSVRLN